MKKNLITCQSVFYNICNYNPKRSIHFRNRLQSPFCVTPSIICLTCIRN